MTEAGTGIDRTVPHSARIWNYWLGGKDNYPRRPRGRRHTMRRDLPAVWHRGAHLPALPASALSGASPSRKASASSWTSAPGCPPPTTPTRWRSGSLPSHAIVYVDNDPLVLAHARSLLTSSREGLTRYVDADLRNPYRILDQARPWLDFQAPIGLLLLGVLGHLPDYEQARSIVRQLLDALPSGSYLVHCDGTTTDASYVKALEDYKQTGGVPYIAREHEQIAAYFEGLELVEPGVVPIHRVAARIRIARRARGR